MVVLTLAFMAVPDLYDDITRIILMICALIVCAIFYDERCQNCGFLVWRRKPEKRFDTGGLFGFIIPRTCRRCGHKHR